MPWLLLALLVVPIVEIYVLVQVGEAIGALPTVLLLVLVSLSGAALLRREVPRSWRAFLEATAAGRVPGREVADGALVLAAGALLLTPGFVSDAVGLLLLLPPVRAALRRPLAAWAGRRLVGSVLLRRAPGRRAGPPGGGRVVDGSVVDGSVVDDRGEDETG